MNWILAFWISLGILVLSCTAAGIMSHKKYRLGGTVSSFYVVFAGMFLAVVILQLPEAQEAFAGDVLPNVKAFLISIQAAIGVFVVDADYFAVADAVPETEPLFRQMYRLYLAVMHLAGPILTFGFVLSFFKNVSAFLRLLKKYKRNVYVFSELNARSLTLAEDILRKDNGRCVVFTDVYESNEEQTSEMMEKAQELGAILFKKDILAVNFGLHSHKKDLYFFVMGTDETENLEQAVGLVEKYSAIDNTHLYVFSTSVESEMMLTQVNKNKMKVRRVNVVRSLVYRNLYERGCELFGNVDDGKREKVIHAVVVGMGRYGRETIKALCWYCQMDGYRVRIDAFDKDPLAEEKFTALCPELMHSHYNGVLVEGEAQYTIKIHSGVDATTHAFVQTLKTLPNVTCAFVSLGDDSRNIETAIHLRTEFERMQIHPVIQAVVLSSSKKQVLENAMNFKGQAYDIRYVGDQKQFYSEEVILDSDLEADALRHHLNWGKEEDFWNFEYNYRSSMATAIHYYARIHCKIPGAGMPDSELAKEENRAIRDHLEALEHRRWNAYMRAEGYVYGAKRNDLAKVHHNLVTYDALPEEIKRLDSLIASK